MNDRLSNSVIGRSRQTGRGFTLVEVLFAVLLVGLSIAGLTAANYAYSQANGAAVDISTAEYLAEQIRELTATMSVDEINAFRGSGTAWRAAINPPIDANQNALSAFSSFSQQMRVEPLLANLSTPDTGANPSFYRVSVQILKNNQEISSSSWIRARY
jgi:prepilin-type N-terminal cleavage/methylation domain-containing protein